MRVATGSYVSDGNSRDVAVAFQPVLVLFQQASGATHYTTLKLSVMSGSNGVDLLNTSRSLASGVCTLTSSGFTVGTSSLVNTSGETYQWCALGADAARLAIGTFTTDNSDDKNISGLPFQPDFVWALAASSGAMSDLDRLWHQSRGGDSTLRLNAASGPTADHIQGVLSGGFQAGLGLNSGTGNTVYYVCMKQKTGYCTQESYTGTGAEHDVVMADPFEPLVVLDVPRTTQGLLGHVASSVMGGWCRSWAAGGVWEEGQNKIMALNADGFRLGITAATNASGVPYDFIAFRDDPTFLISRQFTLPVEGIERIASARRSIPVEMLSGVRGKYALPVAFYLEAGRVRQFPLPVEFNLTAHSPEIPMPVEWDGATVLQRNFPMPVEWQTVLARKWDMPVEWLTGLLRRDFRLEIEILGGIGQAFMLPVESTGANILQRKFPIPVEVAAQLIRAYRMQVEWSGEGLSLVDSWNVLQKLAEPFMDEWSVVGTALDDQSFQDAWSVKVLLGSRFPDSWRVLPQEIVTLFNSDIQLPKATVDKS